MDRTQAVKLIQKTFEYQFDKDQFKYFVLELLNEVEEINKRPFQGYSIPDAFKEHIKSYERIGKYEDPEKNKIHILIVELKKAKAIERARSMQKNFISWYLRYSRGYEKNAALVAFFETENLENWRFSLVKIEYEFDDDRQVKEKFTPAKRYSFLVGKNEGSHTAQRQLIPILESEINPTLKQIEDAFNIEKVTKEFFNKYRELFHDIKEALDHAIDDDITILKDFTKNKVDAVDFSKKLLGQIVFLYFLQKKGWFGVKKNEDWGTGSRHFLRELFQGKNGHYDNYFNDILEPLFYQALRYDRSGDDHYFSQFKCKIPFLNGGLFDPINNYDWVKTDILLPNELFSNDNPTDEGDKGDGILDIFDRYNFTVKEDEPLDKEVAIDPEMLGKVFENLLEVKDRKFKGTYYTHREIVHYMCQESLINYLDTELDNLIEKQDIVTFIHHGENAIENDSRVQNEGRETKTYSYLIPEKIRENAEFIDDSLASIRICDPAIGSGAFPVGMMSEIVRARNSLTPFFENKDNRSTYNFKRHAIKNCLYGVDIDQGAIEIAKLRLWLSLIVDEDDINQIKPLPNLDFKIVWGNSLLGVDKKVLNFENLQTLKTLKQLFFEETNVKKKQDLKTQISDLIFQLSDGNINFDYEIYFSEIFEEKQGFDIIIANPPYRGEKGSKEMMQVIANSNLGKRFYVRRMDLFYFFFHLALDIVKHCGLVNFITTNYFITSTGGFKLRGDLKFRGIILELVNFNELKIFDTAKGQHNMISLLKKNNSALLAQNHIVKTCLVHREGMANEFILNLILRKNDHNTEYFKCFQYDLFEGEANYIRFKSSFEITKEFKHKFLDQIFKKTKFKSINLGKICDLNQGIVSGADKVTDSMIKNYPELNLRKDCGIFILRKQEIDKLFLPKKELDDYVKPFYKNSEIKKWFVKPCSDLFVLYLKDEGKKIELSDNLLNHFEQFKKILIDKKTNCFKNEWLRKIVKPWLERGNYFVLFYPREKSIFEDIKIVNSRRSKSNIFALENNQMYEQSDIVITTLKDNFEDQISIKYILSILNSKLYYLWLYHKGKRKGETLELFQKPLSEIPIKMISLNEQMQFIIIVDKILSLTQSPDYLQNEAKQKQVKEYEREIDRMVYELYELTPEEIEIVEGCYKG